MSDKKKETTLNFFQIVPKNDSDSIEAISEKLRNLKGKQFASMPATGKIIVIPESLKSNDGYLLGAVYNIQMANIPPAMNTQTNEINPLSLGSFDGLAKATCFLIEPQANILVIESNTGVTEKGLCQYLKFNSDLPAIDPAVIINPGQIQKFYQMKSVYQFETKLAVINDGSLFGNEESGENMAISQILNSADNTNTDKLTYKIEISPDNKKLGKSLNKGKVSNFISKFYNYKESSEIESLKVTGEIDAAEGESKSISLELIKERLHEYIEYPIEDRLIQNYYINERFNQIEKVYSRHRQSLLSAYKFESKD